MPEDVAESPHVPVECITLLCNPCESLSASEARGAFRIRLRGKPSDRESAPMVKIDKGNLRRTDFHKIH